MPQTLRAKLRPTRGGVQIEITKANVEAFCDAIGLFRKGFPQALEASERDHHAGRITKRKSLRERRAEKAAHDAGVVRYSGVDRAGAFRKR